MAWHDYLKLVSTNCCTISYLILFNIDGLEEVENLSSLNVSGNMIMR